jgi:hypothetical protein
MPRKKAPSPKKEIPKRILIKDINFFDNKEPKVYNKKSANRNAILFFLFFISLFAVLYPSGKMFFENRAVKADIAQLQSMMSNETETANFEALQDKIAALKQAEKYADAIGTAADKFAAFPKADPEIMDLIDRKLAGDVLVLSLNYIDGIYTVSCLAEDVLSPAHTVENLLSSGAFQFVKYEGFQVSYNTGGYQFSVVCAVKGGAE